MPTAGSGKSRDIVWGACCFLADVVAPQIQGGALDKLWQARGSGQRTLESDRRAQQVFRTMFGMPEMVSIIALRDVGLLTSRDARGPVFDRHLCDSVMSNAAPCLDRIIPSSRGTRSERLRARMVSQVTGSYDKFGHLKFVSMEDCAADAWRACRMNFEED